MELPRNTLPSSSASIAVNQASLYKKAVGHARRLASSLRKEPRLRQEVRSCLRLPARRPPGTRLQELSGTASDDHGQRSPYSARSSAIAINLLKPTSNLPPTSGLGRVDDWRGDGPARPDLYPLRLQPPLGEPDVRISRIRLSPGSCLRTRKVARLRQQAHQPQSQDQELVGDAARPLPAHLVLPAQPPAEPRTRCPVLRQFVEPHRTRLLPSLSHAVPYGVSRPVPVLPDSFVNHLALAPASTTPRPGVLSSSGITRSQRYYDPIRHPRGPVPRLTAPPLASAARQPPSGVSRVAHDPSFAHAVATTPAEPLGANVALLPQRRRPSPYLRRVGFRIALFEACSAFTARYGLCAR